MAGYITDIVVQLEGPEDQKLIDGGYTKIDLNLNEGAKTANYLWYLKKGSNRLTSIQFTFNVEMCVGLIKAGYIKNPTPIIPAPGADPIYLWKFRGSGEFHTPIADLEFTSTPEEEAKKFKYGWEKLACDLHREAGGTWLYLWVKRENQTYICDVAVTDSFKSDTDYFENGWIRVDEDARRGAGREYIFIWYRQTIDPKSALRDLNVSTTEEEFQIFQEQNIQPVNLNFREWIGSHPMYLWYKGEESGKPIKAITLVLNTAAVPVYKKNGITVIEKDLSAGTKGCIEYLCFNQ